MRLILIPLLIFASPGLAVDRVSSPGIDAGAPKERPPSGWGRPVIGRLRNGVRFAILPRQGSEPGVALLMRNEGGFIAERRPGERGLAHLIEHIVFHSPTAGSQDDFDHLKRIGIPLTFSAPNAGSTSWRETNYYLSTRSTALVDLDVLLTLFREAATAMTLRADAVDASRGEVLREMADKQLGNDIYADYIAAVAPGSPNDVIDRQNSDDVPIASIATIRGLYRRLYRPDAMMIVVVGNVKADEVRSLIERRFGDWQRSLPAPHQATFPMFRRDRIRSISFSALPQARRTALMAVVMPTPAAPSSRDRQMRAKVLDLLATQAVGDRLAAARPGSDGTGIFIENGEQGHRQIMLWDTYTGGQWQPAVAVLRRTACDLARFGFTATEWEAAKRNLLADLERRVAAMPSTANVDIAKELSHALADGRFLIPSDELIRYARTMLSTVDAPAGSRWWRQQWGSGVEHLRVEAPELREVADPVSTIRAAANAGVSPICQIR